MKSESYSHDAKWAVMVILPSIGADIHRGPHLLLGTDRSVNEDFRKAFPDSRMLWTALLNDLTTCIAEPRRRVRWHPFLPPLSTTIEVRRARFKFSGFSIGEMVVQKAA